MTSSHTLRGREITRRKFIAGLAAAAAGAVVARRLGAIGLWMAGAEEQQGWLALGRLSELTPGIPAGYPYIRRVRDGWVESIETGLAYVLTTDGRDVRVFANVCTHGGCRVTWDAPRRVFLCPCHGGSFAADGRVLSGLPPQPLEQLASRVVDGVVQVHLPEMAARPEGQSV